MIVACENCGAPLDVPDGQAMVPCKYCGQTNRVRSMRTLHEQTPANWQPPSTWQPPSAPSGWQPAPIEAPPARPGGSGGAGCRPLLVVLPLLIGLAAVGLPLYMSGALSAIPGFGLELDGEPSIRTIDLDAEPNPAPLAGATGSGIDLGTVGGSSCRGQVGRQPHLVLRTSGSSLVSLSVNAGFDSVMALRTSDGTLHCDDDSNGNLDPAIQTLVPAGEHRVWVGAFSSGNGGSFTLHVSADQAAGAGGSGPIALEGAPTLGTLAAGPGVPIGGRYESTVYGFNEARDVDPSCRGYVPSAPHLAVQVDSEEMVRFTTRSGANQDLVMMVRDANGRVYCDDDSGGSLQPQVDLMLPVGVTRVWVGSFSRGTSGGPFELLVGGPGRRMGEIADAITFDGEPTLGTVDLAELDETTTYRGVASGDVATEGLGPMCRGYIGRQPDLVIESSEPRDVELFTRSGSDLVMVVRGPDGSITCDDDSGRGTNPQIHQSWEPGTHVVFIGTYAEGRTASYELVLEERPVARDHGIDHPTDKL